ncbi:MAG: four helix bundle protein [Proteobacteria bacterium]|nr:four helix bundle protein [Pseudomonadota bacterium]
MKIERFEDIEAWKEARKLVQHVYRSLRDCRDFGFCDQMQRAAVSVMSNIAEGFNRGSNKEYVQFLVVARASASEVRSLSYAALDLAHITEADFDEISKGCVTTANLINGFIRYLRSSTRKG